MRYARILVAVDDSPAGLAAARTAIELAAGWGAAVKALTVAADHVVTDAIGREPSDTVARITAGGRSLLAWVGGLAAERGVPCELDLADGEPARRIIEEAEAWKPQLIVIGRSDRRGPSSPYLGSETAHVLEFAEQPVLVVPGGVPTSTA